MKIVITLLTVLGFSTSALASFWSYNCSTADGSIVIKRGQTEQGVFLNVSSYKETTPDQWQPVVETQTFDIYGGSIGNDPQTTPEASEIANFPNEVAYITNEIILVPVSESRFNPPKCAQGEQPQGTVGGDQVVDVREISFKIKGKVFQANEFPYVDASGVVTRQYICDYAFSGMAMSCIK